MGEVLNANPVIRNAAELPARRRPLPPPAKKDPLAFTKSVIPDAPTAAGFYSTTSSTNSLSSEDEDDEAEPIDEQEIYDLIATISDPEHPLSLGSLAVVNLQDIHIRPLGSTHLQEVTVEITPTITHCSLATLIGLGVRVRLEQALPPRFRVNVRVKEGTHSTGDQVNKQLGDKERVSAALENAQLMGVLRKMMETCE